MPAVSVPESTWQPPHGPGRAPWDLGVGKMNPGVFALHCSVVTEGGAHSISIYSDNQHPLSDYCIPAPTAAGASEGDTGRPRPQDLTLQCRDGAPRADCDRNCHFP